MVARQATVAGPAPAVDRMRQLLKLEPPLDPLGYLAELVPGFYGAVAS